jgi:hypothetical protein
MGFDPAWLALREPADHAARDAGLLAQAARVAAAAGPRPVIVDLGAGTGSTARAFAGHLPPGAAWRLVDADTGLLTLALGALSGRGTGHALDLGDLDALPLDGAALVTASALLDLMPEAWVDRLAARLAALRLPFYAALSYDGQMGWEPALPGDAAVTAAFNRNQRGDKGLGPALGPDAGARTAAIFRAHGFRVTTADSPWRLGPAEADLQRALLAGIAEAAAEAGAPEAEAWGHARIEAAGSGRTVIGHLDLLALPGGAA